MAYYLDDDKYGDGLPSIKRSGLIDVNTRRSLKTFEDSGIDIHGSHVRFSSTAPSGLYRDRAQSPSIYQRPTSPTHSRRMTSELQEQLRVFKEEMKKKDQLIAQLSSIDTPASSRNVTHRSFEMPAKDGWKGAERMAAENARSELAALQVKCENLESKLRELQLDNDSKDSKIRELRNEMENLKQNDARQGALIHSLRERIHQAENSAGSLESVANRSEVTITTLQKENREAQDRILELESRLRTHLQEREVAEQEKSNWEKRYQDLVSQFSNVLRADEISGFVPASIETLVCKLSEIVQENALLKGKMVTLQETLANTELESKASRETIMRLVSEVGREQKTSSHYTSELDMAKSERDSALAAKRDLEREVELLQERLGAKQKAWDATRRELEMRDGRLSSLDREMRETSHSVRATQTQYSLFKEQLSSLLSDVSYSVDLTEEGIRERIRHLQAGNKDKEAHIGMLESKLKSLSEKFEKQYEIRQSAERRIQRMEAENVDLQDRLRRTEGDCAANAVFRDGLRTDKERYLRFMEKVAESLKMDRISAEIGYDMNGEAIVARCQQLIKLEADALADRSTHIYNLQRKIKSMKEQLESKDLHLDLLRKKITGTEERLLGRTELEREKDGETLKVRKQQRLMEKYQSQVVEARQEIVELKAQLLNSSSLKVRTLEQDREIETLENKLAHLDKIRYKQSKKISNLKEEVDFTEHELGEKKVVSENAVQALSSELRITKQTLEDTAKRERQLIDLRQVISRMLGLEINTLAVPDYEIISRLEKLIQAHHAHTVSAIGLETAIEDIEDGFRSGYEDAARFLASPRASRRRSRSRTRTRSMSPQRRVVDPKQY